jgi:hypothetical protein
MPAGIVQVGVALPGRSSQIGSSTASLAADDSANAAAMNVPPSFTPTNLSRLADCRNQRLAGALSSRTFRNSELGYHVGHSRLFARRRPMS